ncbi:serine hydrolase domain-containing protein [Mucilaginibacter lutimaris]|uniref:Serine hydrolase domain-containing protein n=1 Tax=Mucilaginibacter lutimaris TaxID=931629 RepID=A0ABW2ZFP1_9SPHI
MKQLKPILYILIFAQSYCFAQSKAPSAAEQALFQKLTDVYNTNDSAAYSKFYSTQLTDPKKIADNVRQMQSEYRFGSGKVMLKAIKHVSATETELIFKTVAYGSWLNFLWVTDSAGHFKEHHMRPVRLGTNFLQAGTLTQKQILDSVDSYIHHLVAQNVFAGNVIIAKNGNMLYNKSFGNNPSGKPNTVNEQIGLASMGKLFTTISILQLADRGKLSLNDSMGKLMPQLQNKALTGITVKQLLTHTSGMGDYFEDPAYDPMANKQFNKSDILPAIEKDKPHFAPGKGFRYSNTGFLLLGLIIERLSGLDFGTYVLNNICKPADMTVTMPDGGAGGGTSTVTDIYKLSKAIKNNVLLKPATTAMFMNEHVGEWGLGQEYQQLGNEFITGHSGGFIGICTELNMYHKTGYTVVILSNTEPPFGHFLSDKIKELIIRK